MKITKRIKEIVNACIGSRKVADIGCDHGYVGIDLILNHNVSKVIFSDILRAPLCSAIANVKLHNIEETKVDFRVGDGLSSVEFSEVDTIVITGMGGKLISDILAADLNKTRSFKRFVLQPTNGEEILRKWLNANCFIIVMESLIEENGIYYETLLVEQGKENLSDTQIKFGKLIDYKDKEFVKKYKSVLEKLEKTKLQIPVKNVDALNSFNDEISKIKKVLDICE